MAPGACLPVRARTLAAAWGVVLCGILGLNADAQQPAPEPTRLHVAADGNDAWSGQLPRPNANRTDGPVATLLRARDLVRGLKGPDGTLKTPVRVEIADGVYFLHAPLELTPQDSGTAEAPVSYAAAPNAKPVISGGRVITGWKKQDDGKLWRAEIPEAIGGKWPFRQLFVNGIRCARARHPNAGDYWFFSESGATLKDGEGSFKFREGDIQPWAAAEPPEVFLHRIWDVSWFRATRLDPATQTLYFGTAKNLQKTSHWERMYWLENSLAYLDAPGEWFLDTATGVVTLCPPDGVDLANATVIAPVIERLVQIKGAPGQPVQYVRFTGLTFKHADWSLPPDGYDGHQADVTIGAGVMADFAESITFQNCVFAEQGNHALQFEKGCRKNVIDTCEFRDLGGGAILVGTFGNQNPPEAEQTFDNQIVNCEVHHNGAVYPSAVGIGVGYAHHNLIARNHVHHTSYTGISVGFGWTYAKTAVHDNVIEGNHLHDIQLVMGDGAAIYTLSRQPGTIIRGNVIHDVQGYLTYGSGIYLDNNSSEVLVENNLVARTICASVVNNAVGRDNILRNNIFALAATDSFHLNGCKDNTLVGNIIYIREGCCGNWTPDNVKEMDRNLYWFAGDGEFVFPDGMTLDDWRGLGFDKNSIVADPLFKDVANGDFSLRPESPALTQLGFKPFDTPVLGPPPPDRRQDPRLVKLFNLTRGVRDRNTAVQVVRHANPFGSKPPVLDARAKVADSATAVDPSLRAWWPFDEVTPTRPGGQMQGALQPGCQQVPGVAGTALALDGKTGKVDVPPHPALAITDAITAMAWVKLEPQQTYKGALGIIERPQVCRLMVVEAEAPYSVRFGAALEKSGLFEVQSERNVAAGAWTHVAGTYDSTTGVTSVYVNGRLAQTKAATPGAKILKSAAGFQIGRRDDRAYLCGTLDEVRIYARALTEPEIAAEHKRLAPAGTAAPP